MNYSPPLSTNVKQDDLRQKVTPLTGMFWVESGCDRAHCSLFNSEHIYQTYASFCNIVVTRLEPESPLYERGGMKGRKRSARQTLVCPNDDKLADILLKGGETMLISTQQNLIHPDAKLKAILEFIGGESNKLTNCGIYSARQRFFKTHK